MVYRPAKPKKKCITKPPADYKKIKVIEYDCADTAAKKNAEVALAAQVNEEKAKQKRLAEEKKQKPEEDMVIEVVPPRKSGLEKCIPPKKDLFKERQADQRGDPEKAPCHIVFFLLLFQHRYPLLLKMPDQFMKVGKHVRMEFEDFLFFP